MIAKNTAKGGAIDVIYISLLRRQRWRFAIHRQSGLNHHDFEIVSASSLPDLLVSLLDCLSPIHSNFIEKLDHLDNERLQKSSHRTTRYFDERFAPEWRRCLPRTIGINEARAISGLACDAAGIACRSINLPLANVLAQ